MFRLLVVRSKEQASRRRSTRRDGPRSDSSDRAGRTGLAGCLDRANPAPPPRRPAAGTRRSADSRDRLPDRCRICQNGRRSRAGLAAAGSIRYGVEGVVHVAIMLGSFIMNRREFLQAGAATAGLALSAAGYHVAGLDRRGDQAGRPDRLRLVRQGRPAPAHPGRAGRGRLALRRRQEDARRGRRDRRHPPGLEEEPRAPTPTTARCSRRRTSTSS